MRATISFEADVSRVNDIMRSLVLEESIALQDAFICLEKATADRIVEGVSEALNHIYTVANQLEQYRDMMLGFERARFETMLPQPAQESLENLGNIRETIEETKRNVQGVEEALSNMSTMDPNDIPAAEPVFDPSEFDPSQLKGLKDTVTQMRRFANFIKGAEDSSLGEEHEPQEG